MKFLRKCEEINLDLFEKKLLKMYIYFFINVILVSDFIIYKNIIKVN